jgi:LysM repeat protein
MMQKIALLLVILAIWLSGCSQVTQQATPTVKPTELITPYHTPTSTRAIPTATIKVTVPVTPLPTPTPLIYTLKGDETMLGIAYQFGIDWKDLQAANPDVDPHYMGPGLQLVIPVAQKTPEVQPTPTAVPANIEQTDCYPTGDGGAWCIVAIHNDQEVSIENLSAWIGLYSLGGELITSQVAYAPLNILRPGDSMPLMALFSAPLPNQYQVQSEVLSGLPVADEDPRYIDLQAKVNEVKISQDGSQAEVKGEVILPGSTTSTAQLWILVVAYDPSGNIVGVRKWKSGSETEFDVTVYSLAGAIEHAEVLIEARP